MIDWPIVPLSARGRHRYAMAAAFFVALSWPTGLTAQPEDSCLDPSSIEDADFARHTAELSNPVLCITEQRFDENDRSWHLIVIRNTELSGPLWAVPHDEEDVAFSSAIDAVLRHGGVVVSIENDENRTVGGIDPNHVFALTDEAATICETIGAPAPLYVEAFLAPWDRTFPVIGLHSNWDGFADEGGLGTISVRRLDDKMIPFASPIAAGRFADEDTIAMLVGETPPAQSEPGQAAIDWFNSNGVHVIYRLVSNENNGCTLADFLTLNRLGPYFNLEVEHGDFETQLLLIDRLMAFLASDAYRGML